MLDQLAPLSALTYTRPSYTVATTDVPSDEHATSLADAHEAASELHVTP